MQVHTRFITSLGAKITITVKLLQSATVSTEPTAILKELQVTAINPLPFSNI